MVRDTIVRSCTNPRWSASAPVKRMPRPSMNERNSAVITFITGGISRSGFVFATPASVPIPSVSHEGNTSALPK